MQPADAGITAIIAAVCVTLRVIRTPLPGWRFDMRHTSLVLLAIGLSAFAWGQGRSPAPPPINASTDPLLRGFEFRSIGPATMMGRVDDIAGAEKDPLLLYVGFATGGLWKSADGGNHWKAMFD